MHRASRATAPLIAVCLLATAWTWRRTKRPDERRLEVVLGSPA